MSKEQASQVGIWSWFDDFFELCPFHFENNIDTSQE